MRDLNRGSKWDFGSKKDIILIALFLDNKCVRNEGKVKPQTCPAKVCSSRLLFSHQAFSTHIFKRKYWKFLYFRLQHYHPKMQPQTSLQARQNLDRGHYRFQPIKSVNSVVPVLVRQRIIIQHNKYVSILKFPLQFNLAYLT